MRHVAVMTATGSIGLMAIFVVDFFSLLYVSRLGDPVLKAAVGYASQILFLAMAVNIGLTIAASATVSRALGEGNRPKARRLAASALTLTTVMAAIVSLGLFLFRDEILHFALHAQGRSAEIASRFLTITLPANIVMGLGMCLSGILRAVGDARRAMYVTLSGGLVTAVTDPLLIFGFGLGVYGAAWATVISRLVFLVVGLYGAVRVHNLVAKPDAKAALEDFRAIMFVGGPAIVANLATPVAAVYTTRVFSDFGDQAVAAAAIIDRIVPVLFGVIFALTGSIGPIIGQNLGAGLISRVRRAITDSFILSVGYAVLAWGALALAGPLVVAIFDAQGESAALVTFFARYGVSAWVFITCLFVANTAFNNLGFPYLSMAFNWGRATLGTIPLATLGAKWGGVEGAMLGIVAGAAVFGLGAMATAYLAVARLAKRVQPDGLVKHDETSVPSQGNAAAMLE